MPLKERISAFDGLDITDEQREILEAIRAFVDQEIIPVAKELEAKDEFPTRIVDGLREMGAFGMRIPTEYGGLGLDLVTYALAIAELTRGWMAVSGIVNGQYIVGGMIAAHGSDAQKDAYLPRLAAGEIRSCFSMTEPGIASSDATNISTRITRDGDHYVIQGTKWWSSGAMDPRCKVAILMGKTDPEASPHRQQSMILVPLDAPGVKIKRDLTVFGFQDQHGHAEIHYDDVRVPATSILGEEGGGFAIAQARLGPGRIHHCMRTIGMAERALEMLCKRALSRSPFGVPLSEQGVIQTWIADARMRLDQARLYTMYTAWLMDTQGNKAAHNEISGIKVAVMDAATEIIDRAIQVHGAAGVGPDTPLPRMYAGVRSLHFADGPDEVHRRGIARRELRRWAQ